MKGQPALTHPMLATAANALSEMGFLWEKEDGEAEEHAFPEAPTVAAVATINFLLSRVSPCLWKSKNACVLWPATKWAFGVGSERSMDSWASPLISELRCCSMTGVDVDFEKSFHLHTFKSPLFYCVGFGHYVHV